MSNYKEKEYLPNVIKIMMLLEVNICCDIQPWTYFTFYNLARKTRFLQLQKKNNHDNLLE